MNFLNERMLAKKFSTLTPIEKCARHLWLDGQEDRAIKVLSQLEALKQEIGVLTSICIGNGLSLEA